MSKTIKLNNANLSNLPGNIKVPTYQREQVRTNIVHIGIGGFHRAHQAYFANALLEKYSSMDWGICGVALLENDRKIYEVLSKQQGLYTLMVPDLDGTFSLEVIGSLIEVLFAPDNPVAIIEKMADPTIKIITLTITEGGYNFTGDGNFNWDNQAILWDLEHPDKPKTVFGYLYSALKLRRKQGAGGLTILSCDNMEHNGDVLRSMFYAFVSKADSKMLDWLKGNVSFPNSMVDRITPATTQSLKAKLATNYGLDDKWPVISESFYQWIIEDSFISGRPNWEKVGIQMVEDVAPYEKMKIRLLNGGHTLVGLAGFLSGYQYIDQSVSDPIIGRLLKQYMDNEVSDTLDPVPGIDLSEYKRTIIQRFKNPFIKDEVARIISGSSAKFPKFILPTILDRLKSKQSISAATLIVSAWYVYLTLKISNPMELSDDLAPVLLKSVEKAELKNNPLLFLDNTELFRDLGTYPAFTESFLSHTRAIQQSGIGSRISACFKDDKAF